MSFAGILYCTLLYVQHSMWYTLHVTTYLLLKIVCIMYMATLLLYIQYTWVGGPTMQHNIHYMIAIHFSPCVVHVASSPALVCMFLVLVYPPLIEEDRHALLVCTRASWSWWLTRRQSCKFLGPESVVN